MSEWQPIETVPQDGTLILVANGGLVSLVYWDGYDWTVGDDEAPTYCGLPWTPRYWMPVPVPPK